VASPGDSSGRAPPVVIDEQGHGAPLVPFGSAAAGREDGVGTLPRKWKKKGSSWPLEAAGGFGSARLQKLPPRPLASRHVAACGSHDWAG